MIDVGTLEVVVDREQAVQAGDTDVEEASDAYAEGFGCDCGFFGDGNVAGSSADYGDVAFRRLVGKRGLAQRDGVRYGVVRRQPDASRAQLRPWRCWLA